MGRTQLIKIDTIHRAGTRSWKPLSVPGINLLVVRFYRDGREGPTGHSKGLEQVCCLPISMKVSQYLNNSKCHSCVTFYILDITDTFILLSLLNNVLAQYWFIFSQHFEYITPWSSGFSCCIEKSFEDHHSYKCNMFLFWGPF